MQHFLETVTRDPDDRYIVKMRWVDNPRNLSDIKAVSERKCIHIAQKLKKRKTLRRLSCSSKRVGNKAVSQKQNLSRN